MVKKRGVEPILRERPLGVSETTLAIAVFQEVG
jgi:hypothetical protein